MRGGLGSSSIIGTGTRYDLKCLHQYGKRVKTKSQRVLGANSYVCRNCWEKTGRRLFYSLPHILNSVKFSYSLVSSIYPIFKYLKSKSNDKLQVKDNYKWGITKPCTHLHPAPSTSTQLIAASTQLSVTPSIIFGPKYCT